ncbi:MAG: MarR family transcriptional regulator [Candidatus Marinimicrobia bacterium]|nr:MarR family transcriptional regulator [Candidatus Neomarinimicrobiota bacterium]
MSDNEQTVLDVIKKVGKPIRPGDIAKETGLDTKEVSKAINTLKKKGYIISPKRCFYAPAEK